MQDSSQDYPVIGVTTKFGAQDWVEQHTINYLNALEEFAAVGVALSPDTSITLPSGETFSPDAHGRYPRDLLTFLDGLILAGGGDVHPSFFGEEMNGANPSSIHIPRDELELTLARQALDVDLPTFGICRGCQVLNVAAGGSMIQHFDGHRSPRENPVLHDIIIDQSSHLYGIVEVERLPSNTYHHQGLDEATLAPIFRTTGVADPDSWLIEAFESKDHQWMIGVQWHPERLYELPDAHRKLWADFVQACILYRQRAREGVQ